MGAWASCGPDLNRDKEHDEIILMVSRQLFWWRVSCQEHTPPWGPVLMRVCMLGPFYPKHWESLGLFSPPVIFRSWKKGSLTSWFPFQSRMLEFSLGTRPPCFPSTRGLILGGTQSPVLSCTSLLLFLHSLSGLGRNIILTTMPAGTKLIAGNKPVSFLTAQQLQQLQQQGQATQVRSRAHYWPSQASPSSLLFVVN